MGNEDFMREAVRLAVENVANGGGPFGAVLVKDGKILSRGVNRVTRLNDPTAHAEIMAIRMASEELKDFDLSGCEIYSSCEPCPMCLGAIYWARIDKVYFGADKFDASRHGFADHTIEEEIKKDWGQRSLPMVQMIQKHAQSPFLEWEKFVDRKRY